MSQSGPAKAVQRVSGPLQICMITMGKSTNFFLFSKLSNKTKTHKSEELKIFRGQMIGRVKLSTRPFILSFEWTIENLNDPFNEKLNILLLTPSNKKNAVLRKGSF